MPEGKGLDVEENRREATFNFQTKEWNQNELQISDANYHAEYLEGNIILKFPKHVPERQKPKMLWLNIISLLFMNLIPETNWWVSNPQSTQ